MPTIKLELVVDSEVGEDTAIHLLNEVGYKVLPTDEKFTFAMQKKHETNKTRTIGK